MNKRIIESNVILPAPHTESGIRLSIATLHASLFFISMLCCSSVFAFGFGDLQLQSSLGQAFRATVNLVGSDSTSVERYCFSANLVSYEGAPLGRLILDIKEGSSDVTVSGVPPVNEPAAKFILSHTCKPKMQREYSILLDPPMSNLATVGASSSKRKSQAAQQQDGLPAIPVGAGEGTEKPKKSGKRTVREQTPVLAKTLIVDENISPQLAQEPAPAKKRKKEKAAVAAAPVNVLRLGASDHPVTDLPGGGDGLRLAMTYRLSGLIPTPASELPPVAAIAPEPSAAELASAKNTTALQEMLLKISALEKKTEELRKLNATQLLALEDAKKAPPIKTSLMFLYVLLFGCVLAIGWLIWRMRQIRSKEGTWKQMVPDNEVQGYNPEMETRHFPAAEQSDALKAAAFTPALVEDVASAETKLPKGPVKNNESDFDEHFYSHDKPKIAAAEELSDAEQEAEFWLNINQPLRAIEILEAKSGEDRPSSPLLWMNLLDLYRIVGDRQKYEALGKKFKNVFNGRVALWEEPLTLERPRGIEDYPAVMNRIVQLWPTDALIPFMEELLVDDRDGNREGFELSVYRDVLFLTNIAHKIQLSKKFDRPSADAPSWSIL